MSLFHCPRQRVYFLLWGSHCPFKQMRPPPHSAASVLGPCPVACFLVLAGFVKKVPGGGIPTKDQTSAAVIGVPFSAAPKVREAHIAPGGGGGEFTEVGMGCLCRALSSHCRLGPREWSQLLSCTAAAWFRLGFSKPGVLEAPSSCSSLS